MKVKELKERLKGIDDNMPVILQIDPEGNGYHVLHYVDPDCVTEAVDLYFVEDIYSTQWSYEEAGFENEEDWEDFKKENIKCLVLAP